jgi:hypothetical protein
LTKTAPLYAAKQDIVPGYFNKIPLTENCRDQYYVALKAYNGFLRRKKRQYINSVVDTIVNASKSNPKIFWNSLKSLMSGTYITAEDIIGFITSMT